MSEEKKLESAQQPKETPEAAREAEKAGAQEKEKDTLESTVYDWGRCLIAAVVTVVLVFTFLLRLISVSGISMQNTLYDGDKMVVVNAALCDFAPGDVVVVNAYNTLLSETIVKRIIAVEGQTVDIDFFTGMVYVDGVALEEPYTAEPTYTTDGTQFPLTLGEGEVFLMGDNRNHSTDSRSYALGPVREEYIQGKAVFLILPGRTPETGRMDFGRIGLIK